MPDFLVNFAQVEAIPAALARGQGNATARVLAQARWLLRRKRDGRYLALLSQGGHWHWLLPQAFAKACGRLSLEALRARLDEVGRGAGSKTLPLEAVRRMLAALGVGPGYGEARQLALVAEPAWLVLAGRDRYQRPLWLRPDAARAWRHLRTAAAREGVVLEAVSGYRSHAYQYGIFRRKLARGLSLEEILAVNAAPGYSEHHSGQALDLAVPGQGAAVPEFEQTAAFAWLQRRAGDFGFGLSYPRGNRHGIVYEPWHWCFAG